MPLCAKRQLEGSSLPRGFRPHSRRPPNGPKTSRGAARAISQRKHPRQACIGGWAWPWLDASMPSGGSASRPFRTFLLLFLFLNFLYLLTSSGRVRTIDEVMVDYETESLILRGSTAVPQAIASGLFYGKLDRAA